MSIRFPCVSCQKRIKVPDGTQGKRVQCPACGTMQRVPEHTVPDASAPSSSSSSDASSESVVGMPALGTTAPSASSSSALNVLGPSSNRPQPAAAAVPTRANSRPSTLANLPPKPALNKPAPTPQPAGPRPVAAESTNASATTGVSTPTQSSAARPELPPPAPAPKPTVPLDHDEDPLASVGAASSLGSSGEFSVFHEPLPNAANAAPIVSTPASAATVTESPIAPPSSEAAATPRPLTPPVPPPVAAPQPTALTASATFAASTAEPETSSASISSPPVAPASSEPALDSEPPAPLAFPAPAERMSEDQPQSDSTSWPPADPIDEDAGEVASSPVAAPVPVVPAKPLRPAPISLAREGNAPTPARESTASSSPAAAPTGSPTPWPRSPQNAPPLLIVVAIVWALRAFAALTALAVLAAVFIAWHEETLIIKVLVLVSGLALACMAAGLAEALLLLRTLVRRS